jgi:hypothetical protein
VAGEGPRRSRAGISWVQLWSRERLGLLLLVLVVLPWLPIIGPPSDNPAADLWATHSLSDLGS